MHAGARAKGEGAKLGYIIPRYDTFLHYGLNANEFTFCPLLQEVGDSLIVFIL